mmetsp:Transcript_14934/g.24821  ORF Transcript_14934/g.24821 Transcript_14934/m.24821 type:complete len:330 (+) Transcript_14934:158-1147(+)
MSKEFHESAPLWIRCGEEFELLQDDFLAVSKHSQTVQILPVSHTKHCCVELVVFSAAYDIEAPRVYINSDALKSLVDDDELQHELIKRKDMSLRKKKKFDEKKATRDVRNALTIQLLDDLIKVDGNSITVSEPLVENFPVPLLYVNMPEGLHPVEIDMEKRQRIVSLTKSTVSHFRSVGLSRQLNKEQLKTYSKPRLRWIRAILLVMRQLSVARSRSRVMRSTVREWFLSFLPASLSRTTTNDGSNSSTRSCNNNECAIDELHIDRHHGSSSSRGRIAGGRSATIAVTSPASSSSRRLLYEYMYWREGRDVNLPGGGGGKFTCIGQSYL